MYGTEDRLYDTVEIFGEFSIPEAQNAIAMGLKISRACCVVRLSRRQAMLITVEFDHELRMEMSKICEIGTHRSLTAEVASG